MIISHKHKTIFTFPPKTGGTSVQGLFIYGNNLGENDICSPFRLDYNSGQFFPGQNLPPISEQDIRRLNLYPIPNPLRVDNTKDRPLLRHLTLKEILKLGLISEKDLKKFTIYVTLNDPIERFIDSFYFGQFQNNGAPTLGKFQEQILQTDLTYPFLGKTYYDYLRQLPANKTVIWKTANLTELMLDFCRKRDMSFVFLHAKQEFFNLETKNGNWRRLLSIPVQKKLENFLKKDIEVYNDPTRCFS